MTGKSIDYYDSMSSPWTYLGHLRFEDLCRRFDLTINHKPMDLLKVWSVSGGLPLRERAKQRQAYRHQELRRWRELLGAFPATWSPPTIRLPTGGPATSRLRRCGKGSTGAG
jgi:2-hydroxychromene-2-carboxylate isomerase